jgi:hypothetical protein
VSNDGGGIASEGANIEIQGGVISRNRAKYGGGINSWRGGYSSFNNTLTISGGEISGNIARIGEAAGGGGGVNASNGLRFVMSGGFITGNTAPLGNGIFVAAACDCFKMSGEARIAANNDVYLLNGKTITIDGDLTEAAPVATITPQSPANGQQILTGEAAYLTQANVERFALSTGIPYILKVSGADIGKLAQPTASRTLTAGTLYYPTLAAAIAAAGGTVGTPDEITLISDIAITSADVNALVAAWSGNKHLHLKGGKTILRTEQDSRPLFTIQTNSSLTLENVVVDGGRDAGLWQPSLVVVQGGTLNLRSGAILRKNQSDSAGAGLNMSSGLVTMAAGSAIQDNGSPSPNANRGGAGVYMSGGTFVMEGGEITNNTYSNSNGGGGVRLEGGEFDMRGGTIFYNSAHYTRPGHEVYVNGIFKMSGGAVTGPTNSILSGGDFYLASGKTIQITGTLTGTAPLAKIRPQNTADGTAILSGDAGLVSAHYNKFEIDDDNDTSSPLFSKSIGSDGRLQ